MAAVPEERQQAMRKQLSELWYEATTLPDGGLDGCTVRSPLTMGIFGALMECSEDIWYDFEVMADECDSIAEDVIQFAHILRQQHG